MPNPIELLKLRNNDDTKVIIVGSTNRADDPSILESSKGIMVGDFAVGGSNEFQSLFELASQQDLQNRLSMIKAAYDTVANYVGSDSRMPDIRLKIADQTKLTWITSTSPTYTIPLLFLAIEQNDDVRKEIQELQKAVYPVIKNNLVTPPLQYSSTGNKGRLNIQIGRWFRAVNQVIRSVEFVLSKELVSPGSIGIPTPLYAVGSITFSPVQMPSAKDVGDYFIDRPKKV